MQWDIFVPSFFLSFFLTVILTPVCLIGIKKAGLIDDPRTHKHPAMLHTRPIPRGGGIPLFLGILGASLFLLPLTPLTIGLFTAAALSLVVGVLDDKYDISRYIRFGINIVCASIVVASGVTIAFTTNPLGGIIHWQQLALPFFPFVSFATLLAILWLVWVMNMLNWSKGVDGQMPGIVGISAFVIGILSLRFPVIDVHSLIAAKLSFMIAGACVAFLFFNFYPAKLFPGYGATSMYLLLGAVSILSGAKLATAILVMGVPMVDGAFTIIRRILTKRSPFWHDNKHLHHLLLKIGFGQRRIALFYWTLSAILGGIALSLSSTGKLFAIVMLIVIVGGGLLFLHISVKDR